MLQDVSLAAVGSPCSAVCAAHPVPSIARRRMFVLSYDTALFVGHNPGRG